MNIDNDSNEIYKKELEKSWKKYKLKSMIKYFFYFLGFCILWFIVDYPLFLIFEKLNFYSAFQSIIYSLMTYAVIIAALLPVVVILFLLFKKIINNFIRIFTALLVLIISNALYYYLIKEFTDINCLYISIIMLHFLLLSFPGLFISIFLIPKKASINKKYLFIGSIIFYLLLIVIYSYLSASIGLRSEALYAG